MVQDHMEFGTIREPIVEGIYYPDDADVLENTVRGYLSHSSTPAGNAFAVIVPHASYEFCGPLMADAFKSCAGREVRQIVVLAPYHRDEDPIVFLPESTWYRTPLGLVPVHTESVRRLADCGSRLIRNDIPHLEEFSIEVQLPFLQYLFPRATIVPILMGAVDESLSAELAAALRTVYGDRRKDLLFVLSANLTDYRDARTAQMEAARALSYVGCGTGTEMIKAYATRDISCCGAGTIPAFLQYIPFPFTMEVVGRGSSRATDRDSVNNVEYAAISYLTTDSP